MANIMYKIKNGYVEGVLKNGHTFQIDIEDFKIVAEINWYKDDKGYMKNRVLGYMHRYILKPQHDKYIDHINRKKTDNRKSNLREVTHQENMLNRDIQNNNTSGYTGVTWHKTKKRWTVRAKRNGRSIYLGSHKVLEKAIQIKQEFEKAH